MESIDSYVHVQSAKGVQESGPYRTTTTPVYETFAHIFHVLDEVVGQGENLQTIGQGVQIIDAFEAIICQAEVLEVGQLFQTTDHLNVVEGQVQPFQLSQRFQATHLLDDVVVQLEFAEVGKLPQVLNSQDIWNLQEKSRKF